MNPTAILGLIGDLYQRVAELTAANAELAQANEQLAQANAELVAREDARTEEASP